MIKISPPLAGGDKGEGEIFKVHPHPLLPPSRGKGMGRS